MNSERFYASTQYGDMKGTSCADNHASNSMRVYLEKNELIHPDELLVGISMFSGEVHTSTQDNPVYVHAYVVKATDFEEMKKLVDSEMPLPVRRISIEMHLNEFFGLFKRFEICVSNNGLIDGKEIEVLESTDVE